MGYISEIKSRDVTPGNNSSDYIEIVLDDGEDPADFDIVLYRNDGTVRTTFDLETDAVVTATLPDGRVIYSISTSVSEGNGSNAPGAVAINGPTGVTQFVSVGNTDVTATEGPANGLSADGVGNSVSGDSHFWAPDGTYNGTDTSTPGAVCFMAGSLIETNLGYRPVETLKIGGLIQTRDNGFQEIRWIGHSHKSKWQMARAPHLAPILIRKHAFGQDCPNRDLYLSPQHRILIQDGWANLLFGEPEVFCATKQLTNDRTIRQACQTSVDYYHVMFDAHEVIKSNGLWSESFLPASYALSSLHQDELAEFVELFPEFNLQAPCPALEPARLILRSHEAAILQKERGA